MATSSMDILSEKFKEKELKQKLKKSAADDHRRKLEEMMQKTLKKSKHDGSEKAKSFTFTESGLVENEDNPENKVVAKRKEHKSLLDSVTEIEVTKKRLKDETVLSSKRRTSVLPEEQPNTNVDLNKRSNSLKISEVASAKSKFSSMMSKRNGSVSKSEDDGALLSASKMTGSARQLGAAIMVTKAIAFMNAPRKERMSNVNKEHLKNRRSSSIRTSSLAAAKFKMTTKPRSSKGDIKENNSDNAFSFNTLLGLEILYPPQLYLKRFILYVRSLPNAHYPFSKHTSSTGNEAQETDEIAPAINIKSIAAAGKFKNRRFKEENHKKQNAVRYFLTWFEGSQALDRVINLERRKLPGQDIMSTELVYMIKRESARQKKSAMSSEEHTEIEDITNLILDCINSVKLWIQHQIVIPRGLEDDEDDDDEVVISLTSTNPQQITNTVNFNYNVKGFQTKILREVTITHLDIPSIIVHKHSEEGREQLEREKLKGLSGARKKSIEYIPAEIQEEELKKQKKKKRNKKENNENREKFEKSYSFSDKIVKNPTNQFQKLERATQTPIICEKNTEMQTDPPPKLNFCGLVNQWTIYDKYQQYETSKERSEHDEEHKKEGRKIRRKFMESPEESTLEIEKRKMFRCGRILERMVNQNNFNDISIDFRFYEDTSDFHKENEGTLLPLWDFSYSECSNMENTALCWNAAFHDLFAAGYGSYDIYNQPSRGLVCVYSLKNPAHPEYICESSSGIMCLDFHPQHPHMLVVGLYNGNVAVYNLQKNVGRILQPVYQSRAYAGKHMESVWQVKWASDDLDNYLNFLSVSEDSRVTQWTLVKTSMIWADRIIIDFGKQLQNINHDKLKGTKFGAGGRALAMKPDDENLFLVGTEEGMIHLCTTEFSSKYLQSYAAHNTPIYTIMWNPFQPSVFISCAAEWSIKIWDMNHSSPLYTFDVQSPAGDVAWAPYSSTTFAAVTFDGKVYVFDLHFDKYQPICVQSVVSKRRCKLNHISFNPTSPILVIGDSKGDIHSLKLSPNLRRLSKEVKVATISKDLKRAGILEVKKLNDLLAHVRADSNEEYFENSDEFVEFQ